MRCAWSVPFLLVLASLATVNAQEGGHGTIHATVCIEYDFPEDHGYHERAMFMPEDECWMDTVEYAPVTAVAADGTVYTATADFHGVAVFPDLPTGRYTISSDAPGFDIDESAVEVRDGERSRVTLAAHPTEVDVTGKLVDEDFAPVAGASLPFRAKAGSWNATTAEDGTFAGTVQTGYHHLEVDIPGFNRGWTSVFVDGSSPLDLMVLRAEGGATLRGQVVDQDGQAVPGAEIDGWMEPDDWGWDRPWSPEPERRDGYLVVSDPYQDPGFYLTADEEGRFETSVVPGWGEISAWADGHRGTDRDFEVAEGDVLDIELVLQKLPDKDAHVTGTVVDAQSGRPIENFSVDIENVALREWTCSQRAYDAAGEVPRHDGHGGRYGGGCDLVTSPGAFEGDVMPGYSILRVRAHGECHGSCRDPYIGHVESVVLETGANAFTVELQRRPAADAAVSGYVLDEEGQPVEHANVNFHNEETYGWGDARIDEFGSYRVQLRAGWHEVSVWAPGFYQWQGMVQAKQGQEVPLDIRLVADPEHDDEFWYGGPYGGPRGMPMPPMEVMMADGMPLPMWDNATMLNITSDGGMQGDTTTATTMAETAGSDDETSDFVDLGGLGEDYDAAARDTKEFAEDDQDVSDARSDGLDIPALPIGLLVAGLAVLAVRRRT